MNRTTARLKKLTVDWAKPTRHAHDGQKRLKPWKTPTAWRHSSGILAGALVRVGEKSRAEELIREMGETPRPIFGRVLYHVLSGDVEAAADWYERAIEEREPCALVFASTPLIAEFRESPRWPGLARMMNLPE